MRLLSDLFKTGPGLSFELLVVSGLLSNALVLSETFPEGTISRSSFLLSSLVSSKINFQSGDPKI